jgi:hypothetical protein
MRSGLCWVAGVLALLVLACSQTAAPPPVADVEATKVATPPLAVPGSAPAVAESPVPGPVNGPVYDARVIHFGGYGPASFLGNEESVRQAFGRPMFGANAPQVETCYYLIPENPSVKGHVIHFMFEGDKFVRYDVRDPDIVAPGGLVIGMSADAVTAAFPGRVEIQPSKYIEGGRVLVVRPETDDGSRLVFEIDAKGAITWWRMGVEPQVHYVEGCG